MKAAPLGPWVNKTPPLLLLQPLLPFWACINAQYAAVLP